jgi:hypothetical protein
MQEERRSSAIAAVLRRAFVLTCVAGLALGRRAFGDSITLVPDADTSLFANFPDNNLGASISLVAGGNGAGLPGRALLHFDVAGQAPSNALIQSVALTVNVVMAPGGGGVNSMFDLHRLLVGWVEGTGAGNTGSPANDGEPTWNDRVYPSVAWATPGGAISNDFSATVSSTMLINGLGAYTFATTPSFVADVQQWLLNPATNFGWILISESESAPFTARRFGAREDPINTSVLQIQYVLPTAPEFQWIRTASGGIQLGFLAAAEQPYTVQYRDSLGAAGWMTLTNIAPQSAATNVIVIDSVNTSARRYYRIGTF